MDFGKLFNTILDLVVQVLLLIPKFINWCLVQIIDLLFLMWPTSASLGIPTVASILDQAVASFPLFPWSVVAHLFGISVALLGGVMIWKAFAALWP